MIQYISALETSIISSVYLVRRRLILDEETHVKGTLIGRPGAAVTTSLNGNLLGSIIA